jgi:hypothetical protein
MIAGRAATVAERFPSVARWVWSNFHICQSMLGATRTAAERQQVVDREQAFNQILAEICGGYARCRWDNLAVYHYQFSASQVSTLDYFHPSLSGQAALARVILAASWWPTSEAGWGDSGRLMVLHQGG